MNKLDNTSLANIDSLKKAYDELIREKHGPDDVKLIAARKIAFFRRYMLETLTIEGSTLTLAAISDYLERDEEELSQKDDNDPVERENYLELMGLKDVLEYIDELGFRTDNDLETKLTLEVFSISVSTGYANFCPTL